MKHAKIYRYIFSLGIPSILSCGSAREVPINSETNTMTTTTVDATEPYLFHSQPSNGSMDFRVNQNIGLHFSYKVIAGSGNIVISNGTDTRFIDVSDSEQVTFQSDYFTSNVIINPAEDLIPDTTYSVQMASGVIVNSAEDAFADISNETQLNFTTVADTSPPSLYTISPSSRNNTLKVDDKIYLTFDETVIAGSGLFIISNGADTRAIDINDTNQVTFDGGTVTISPTDNLVVNTTYSAQMASGVIMDTVGQAYAGLSDASFTTTATSPLLVHSHPNEYATGFKTDDDIGLLFDEAVMAGSGNIIISNGIDTRIIDINDTSQVTFNTSISSTNIYRTVTNKVGHVAINPSVDLEANTNYRVQIANGVIVDTTGHAYAGFSDANFTTIASNPLLDSILLRSNEHPGYTGNSTDFKVGGSFTLFFDEITAAGNGSIILSNSTDTRTIDINDTSQVNFNYGHIIVDLTEDLMANATYTAQITSGAIVDTVGNAYTGFSDASFATIISDPLLISSSPMYEHIVFEADDNIELHFDEVVVAGSGNIVISNGLDTRTIDINDSSQVTFEESQYGSVVTNTTVIINPTDDLIANTTYNIQIAGDVIIDTDGYAYAGINDADTISFTPAVITPTGINESPFLYF